MRKVLMYVLLSIAAVLAVCAFLIPDSVVLKEGDEKEKPGKKSKFKTDAIPDAEVVSEPDQAQPS